MQPRRLSILRPNVCDLQQRFMFYLSVFYLQWGCLLMTQWHTGLHKAISWKICCCCSANRMCWNYQLPCLPQTNGTLNPNTFFYVGTEIFYSVQLPEAMGFFGLSTGPWSSQWFMVVQLTNYSTPSLCLWCEKESTLSLGEAWITMTLKEGRMDICTIPDARIKYFKQPNNSLYQWGVHQITRNLGPRVPQVSDHTIHSTWGVTYLSSLHVLGMSLDLPELPFSFEKCCAKSMILLGLLREILG